MPPKQNDNEGKVPVIVSPANPVPGVFNVGHWFAYYIRVGTRNLVKKKRRCGCGVLEDEMNALGPDGCQARMDDLIERVIESAKKHSTLGRFLASVPLAKRKLRKWLQQAIDIVKDDENSYATWIPPGPDEFRQIQIEKMIRNKDTLPKEEA